MLNPVKQPTLWYINIEPGKCRGWKTSIHYKIGNFQDLC